MQLAFWPQAGHTGKLDGTKQVLSIDFRAPTSGWLSKLWSLFGYPKYQVPYCNGYPKRDHNFDHDPYDSGL